MLEIDTNEQRYVHFSFAAKPVARFSYVNGNWGASFG